MKRRLFSMLLAVGLVLSVFVGVLGTTSAEHTEIDLAESHMYLPWVANGAMIDGTGPWYSTVTVQNLESFPINVNVSVGNGGFSEVEILRLQPNGSLTLGAEALGVPGDGSAVKLNGTFSLTPEDLAQIYVDVALDGNMFLLPVDLDRAFELGQTHGGALDAVIDAWLNEGILDPERVDDFRDEAEQALQEMRQPARIGAVVKQVSPEPSANGKTTSAHTIVDGYTGLNANQVSDAPQGMHVLPIVQTNNNWNTHIRIANLGEGDGLTPFTITLYEAGEGSVHGSIGQFTGSFRPGEVETFNLLEHPAVDEGWVGSAFITTNVPAAAVAERVKAETDMLIHTTSRPIGEEPSPQVAPLVFQDYNFWNTGTSVANTAADGNVTARINYHPPLSGFTEDQRNILPRGMEFVYRPGEQDLNIGGPDQTGVVGSAIISGDAPLAGFVDEVKYFGAGGDVGHAMGYNTIWDLATGEDVVDGATDGDTLALPLFQKGNPNTGEGDTSGIQFFNASADNSATLYINIYDTTGNLVAPTLDEPITRTLGDHENYTLYAHDLHELPVGFQGSVMVEVEGQGEVAAISNNVNYDVAGDGSAAFNLVKIPGLPVDREATSFMVSPQSATNLLGEEHEIVVRVFDQFGQPIDDVAVEAEVTESTAGNLGVRLQPDPALTGDGSITGEVNGEEVAVSGATALTYESADTGQDTIEVTVDGLGSTTVTKSWILGEAALIDLEPESATNLLLTDDQICDVLVEIGEALELENLIGNLEAAEAFCQEVLAGGGETAEDVVNAAVAAEFITEEEGDEILALLAALDLDGQHTVTATVSDDAENLLEGIAVDFEVTAGPNAGATELGLLTDGDGEVDFTYTSGGGTGVDTIVATIAGTEISATASKTWVVATEEDILGIIADLEDLLDDNS